MRHHTLLSTCLRAGFCLALLLSAQVLFGQTVKTIEISYNEKDFLYSYDKDSCIIITPIKSDNYCYNPNEPSLPYTIINVLIPKNMVYKTFTYSVTKSIVHKDVRISQTASTQMLNDYLLEKKSEKWSGKAYPKKIIDYVGTHIIDDYKLLSFCIYPHLYNPSEGSLHFFNKFQLNIHLEREFIEEVTTCNKGNAMKDIVKRLVINPEEMSILYPSSIQTITSINNGYEYLIITNSALKTSFQPLAEWKTQKGVRAKIETIEKIYQDYPNETSNQLKIKRYISDQKNLYGIKYVLLGGDNTIIPVQLCYTQFQNGMGGQIVETNDLPVDMFYACLDSPFDWNSVNNNKVGELEDSIDSYPDIMLTRVPVRTTAHVNGFVNKLLWYEKTPPIDNWNNSFLLCADSIIQVHNGISDGQMLSESWYNDYIGSNCSQKFRFYDTYTDHPLYGAGYELNAQNLQLELSKGYMFVDVKTHGSTTGWLMENGEMEYDSFDALELDNPMPTIITTDACNTNGFDGTGFDPCLSEAFIRNPNSGVIAYLGSSRVTWYGWIAATNQPMKNPASYFTGNFFSELLSSNSEKKFGDLINYVRCLSFVQNHFAHYYKYRWVFLEMNPIGDPEMPIFTTTPEQMTSVSFTFSGDSLIVNSGLSNCRICVMDMDDDDGYYEVMDNVQIASFASLPSHYSVCITKQGYIPYQKDFYNTLNGNTFYIQNETVTENRNYNEGNIMIGSDVTNQRPTGPVTLSNGKTNINSAGDTIILKDFEVQVGAELTIE